MELNITNLSNQHLVNTAWELILLGTEHDYGGIDPESALVVSTCCRYFNELFHRENVDETYWKNLVFTVFKDCQKDYQFKVGLIWRLQFIFYSNEIKAIQVKKNDLIEYKKIFDSLGEIAWKTDKYLKDYIEKVNDYCMLIRESKNASIDKNEIFLSIDPLITPLSVKGSDPKIQYLLGLCYSNGYGVPPSYEMARKICKLSADQGYIPAQSTLGFIIHRSHPKLAFGYTKKAAKQGYKQAIYRLGCHYHEGVGVNKNDLKAFKYFTLSANQGNEHAQYYLGQYYQLGKGTKINLEEAFKYYKMSADKGEKDAQFEIVKCYKNGIGTPVDLQKAIKYCKLSAEQGHSEAKQCLAEWEADIPI